MRRWWRDVDQVAPVDQECVEEVGRRLGLSGAMAIPLAGGSRNRSYRLPGARQDFVLRIDGAHDAEFAVAREAEQAAQRLAAAHGLAPALVLVGEGYAVSEYVPSRPWSREFAASTAGAARAGDWLGRLHALEVNEALREVCFLASLEAYAAQLGEMDSAPGLVASARRVVRELGGFTPAPCHNDLHHLNLIDSPRGLMAIDWEYAGAGDPRMDLAGFVAYHDLDGPAQAALLDAHAACRPACTRDELDLARWLFEAVWWAWLEVRRRLEGGEPGGDLQVRNRLFGRIAKGPVHF